MPLSRMAKQTTSAAPATPQSQNRTDGRSPPISAAKMLVVSGRMPSTTPPWAAGTVCMAIVDIKGKPNTSSRPARNSIATCRRCRRLPNAASTAAAATLAMAARPKLTKAGLKAVERELGERQGAAENHHAGQAEQQPERFARHGFGARSFGSFAHGAGVICWATAVAGFRLGQSAMPQSATIASSPTAPFQF